MLSYGIFEIYFYCLRGGKRRNGKRAFGGVPKELPGVKSSEVFQGAFACRKLYFRDSVIIQ